MERLDITWQQAVDLTMARHAKVFCTQDPELRRLARILEIDVVDVEEFVRRYVKGRDGGTPPTSPTAPYDGGLPPVGGPAPDMGGRPAPAPTYPPFDESMPPQQAPVSPDQPLGAGSEPTQTPVEAPQPHPPGAGPK